MSEWITDRKPMEEDADYGIPGYNGLVFATDSMGQVTICSCYGAAYHGFPWQPIMIPEPYVKQKRFRVEYDEKIGYYVLITADLIVSLPYLSDKHAHKEVAERIAPIYEEMFP